MSSSTKPASNSPRTDGPWVDIETGPPAAETAPGGIEIFVFDAVFKSRTKDPRKSKDIPGIVVQCTRCDFAVEVYGQDAPSIRRACCMLREKCPRKESNFYDAGV